MNNLGWSLVNTAKYIASLPRHTFRQPHAAFHFLLDYVPNWEFSYGRGGLIQYQSFLPKETAEDAWREMLTMSLKRGIPSYLGVTKRHRPDKFLLTHAVDGFSLALDFKVTDRNRAKLGEMLQEFDKIVVKRAAGSTLPRTARPQPKPRGNSMARKPSKSSRNSRNAVTRTVCWNQTCIEEFLSSRKTRHPAR